MADTHQERSRLINDYKTQLRTLQKSLKKKKLPQKQKEEVERQIEELEQKHAVEIADFDTKHGVDISKKKAATEDPPDRPPTELPDSEQPSSLSSRNWGGLSKKELEDCCTNRGLSRKGAKEQLVSRLTIWSVSHGVDPQASADNQPVQFETFNPINIAQTAAKKDEFREKRKKLWKRRSAGPAREGPAESDEESSESSDSEEDQEGSESKPEGRHQRATARSASSDDEVDAGTLQKQRKREAVVASILQRILEKYKTGVKLSEITDKLKEFKVANFTPQLLGYDSLEEWIEGQPRTLLTYKAKNQLILPSVVGALPSSDEDSEEED